MPRELLRVRLLGENAWATVYNCQMVQWAPLLSRIIPSLRDKLGCNILLAMESMRVLVLQQLFCPPNIPAP